MEHLSRRRFLKISAATFGAAAGMHTGNALALDGSGRIVVVGTYDQGLGDTSVWVLRLTTAGALDTTFGRASATPGLKAGEIAVFDKAYVEGMRALLLYTTYVIDLSEGLPDEEER